MSLIKERIAEIHGVLSDADTLVDYLIENEVTSQNYSELSDAMKLLEIFESSFRNKRQLMSIKLRRHYMNQYIEKNKERSSVSIIKSE